MNQGLTIFAIWTDNLREKEEVIFPAVYKLTVKTVGDSTQMTQPLKERAAYFIMG